MATDVKPTLLLVEDSEDDTFFFKRNLRKSGNDCVVHCVTNGSEAIDFLQDAAVSDTLPKAVFLDLKMPLLNGFEVLEWLQAQPFAARLQVVVLSGSDHASDRERAAQLGVTNYLVKPVKISDFDQFLRDICPSNSQPGASF